MHLIIDTSARHIEAEQTTNHAQMDVRAQWSLAFVIAQ